MKRYLYILLGALLFASCEPIAKQPEPDVAFYFGQVQIATTDSSATIDVFKPYITVDGVKLNDAAIYLEYFAVGDEANATKVSEYTPSAVDEHILFEIDGLQPDTSYLAILTIDGGEYGCERSGQFPFTTQIYVPTCSISCDCEVEAKGLMATTSLTNVAYLIDDMAQPINTIKVEYSRTSPEEWFSREFSGSELVDGAMSIELPFEGEKYLQESRNYKLRVTLTPEGDNEPMVSDDFSFKTINAEVTAEFTTPTAKIVDENLVLGVESVRVYFDGIYLPDYLDLEYSFIYRKSGDERWSDPIEADYVDGAMSLSMSLAAFDKGATYVFCGAIVGGAASKMRTSEAVAIEIKSNETPTPPEPPVSGDSDTSTIAGTWLLTEWRGAEPSFDVYLSITEDGVVTLWQRIESREWELYYSTVNYENGTISGEYTDGVAWGASYSVAVSDDTMTWTDTNDATDISVYTRSELPEELVVTRATISNGDVRFL